MSLNIFGEKIIIASHNQGKISEFRDLFVGYDIDLASSIDFNVPEPEENGNTFSENALIKAEETMLSTGYISLSDDSGLCVDALNGDPGIYSARWAGENRDFSNAMDLIKNNLDKLGINNSNANFTCSLAIVWPNGNHRIYEGNVYGSLSFPPKGKNGFGYDPIFVPDGHELTFGEMDTDFKHSISHSAEAFNLLKSELLNDR